jgi:hypothetical protein
MLAASAIARLNQLPALLVLFAAFAWRLRRQPFRLLAAVGLLAGVLLLVPAHNLYYGGRATPLPTSAAIPENYVLPPARIVRALDDGQARQALRAQLRYVLAGQDVEGGWLLRPALLGLQVLWLGTLAWAIARRRLTMSSALVAAVPAVYLGIHVVYQVEVYYPRHILAGHFMMGAAAAILFHAAPRRRRDAAPRA